MTRKTNFIKFKNDPKAIQLRDKYIAVRKKHKPWVMELNPNYNPDRTEKTKSYSWDVPLKFYNPEVFKNDWKKVADHVRSVLIEDLVNPSDYESIDIDAESGRLYIHVGGVKPKLWNYFENERGAEGEED